MHTTTSLQIFTNLFEQHNTLFIDKDITSFEMGIQECTLNAHMGKGIEIPPYLKMGDEKGSKVIYNLHDLAYFLASDTRGSLTQEVRQHYINDFLRKKYGRHIIAKKELASILDVSTNTIGEYMKKGILYPYTKHGKSRNARVTFNVSDISNNLSCVIETM